MANSKSRGEKKQTHRPPARTPEQQERRLISLAMKRAEELLESDNPPPSVVSHFLKLGSSREKAEQEKLERENRLLRAKADSIDNAQEIKAIYEKAMDAIKAYRPTTEDEVDQDPNLF